MCLSKLGREQQLSNTCTNTHTQTRWVTHKRRQTEWIEATSLERDCLFLSACKATKMRTLCCTSSGQGLILAHTCIYYPTSLLFKLNELMMLQPKNKPVSVGFLWTNLIWSNSEGGCGTELWACPWFAASFFFCVFFWLSGKSASSAFYCVQRCKYAQFCMLFVVFMSYNHSPEGKTKRHIQVS